jgi:putative hemolysin
MLAFLLLLLLILANGVFVLAETALLSARKSRLQQWANEGRADARAALALAKQPGRFLTTTTVGITVITILSGAFGEATFAALLERQWSEISWLRQYAHPAALVTVVAGITVLAVLFGELIPKRLAVLYPERIVTVVTPLMQLAARIAHPVVRGLTLTCDAILRLLGVREQPLAPVTHEEIKALMEQGEFRQHEQALVSRVFRMDEQRVTAVMTPRTDIDYYDLNDPPETNRRKMIEAVHSRSLVCRGGLSHVLGVVSAKSLLDDALQDRPPDFLKRATKPLYVPTTLTVTALLETFKKHRHHFALVIDEYGQLQGLVTINDALEMLVGDIVTIEDVTEPDIVRRDDGSWLVNGSIAPDEFRNALAIEGLLPDEEEATYHTLCGLAMLQLGRVPHAGDRFECAGLGFEVVDMDNNRVKTLLVTKLARLDAAADPAA